MATKVMLIQPTVRRRVLPRPLPPDLERLPFKPLPRLKDPIQDFNERFELPRHLFKPLDAIDFDSEGTLGLVANTLAYTLVTSFNLPDGTEGVLKFFGQGADAAGLFIDGNWQIAVNNVPVRGYEGFTFQRGTIASPFPVTIFVPQGATVQLDVKNTSANAYTAYGRIVGYYWIVKDVRVTLE